MTRKNLLLLIFLIILIYPGYWIYRLLVLIPVAETAGEMRADVTRFQLSLWLTWVGMVIISIIFKWIEKNNLFFKLTYIFLVIGFGAFGYFTQRVVTLFENSTRFSDSYTLGVFTAIQHLALAVVLTMFLQIAVRIFQTKWHRR